MSAIKKAVAKTTTTTTTTTTKAVQAPARKVVEDRKRNKQVIVLLDESYSMLGDRWKAAVSGGQSVLMSLSENNYFGLSAYASEFREIYKPMNISKGGEGKSAKGKPYATRRDEINASILRLKPALLSTRMFDSVLDAIGKFEQPPADFIKVQLELIVLTDGGDNTSKNSPGKVNQMLRRHLASNPWMDQFSLTVLAVEMEDDATKACRELVAGMGEVLSVGEHEIKDTFDKVIRKIHGRTMLTSTTATTTTTTVEAVSFGGGGRSTGQIAPSPVAKVITSAPVVGACRYGAGCTKQQSGCKFVHPCGSSVQGKKKGGSSAPAAAAAAGACAFFAVGKCKNGKSCKFLHSK